MNLNKNFFDFLFDKQASFCYFSKETNVDKVERTIKEDDITYVHALYFAICGDNPEYSFEDTYRND